MVVTSVPTADGGVPLGDCGLDWFPRTFFAANVLFMALLALGSKAFTFTFIEDLRFAQFCDRNTGTLGFGVTPLSISFTIVSPNLTLLRSSRGVGIRDGLGGGVDFDLLSELLGLVGRTVETMAPQGFLSRIAAFDDATFFVDGPRMAVETALFPGISEGPWEALKRVVAGAAGAGDVLRVNCLSA